MMNETKKRIVHVVTHFDVGGAERIAASIAGSPSPGFEYHIVEVVRARGAYASRFVSEMVVSGITCHRAHMPDIRFHFVFERLAALCFPLWFLPLYLRLRPAAVHTHTEVPDMSIALFFSLFPRLMTCNIVRTVHNTRLWTGQKKLGARVERFFQRHAFNAAISPSVQQSYKSVYGVQLPIIYNGVAQTRQKPYRGLVEGRINVLFAGRLEPQKGVESLIRVVNALRNDNRYFFHIVGDGSMRQRVVDAVVGCSNARLSPPVHGLASMLGCFSCLFMPSEFEGLSTMSIEASLAGLPVVANDCPGLGDTLPADWPLKVSGNDHDAYIRLFDSVIPSADLTALGRQAQAFATVRFGLHRMQEEYERLY